MNSFPGARDRSARDGEAADEPRECDPDDAASAGSGECSIEILRFLELERQHTESEGAPAGRARRDRPRPANIPLA